MNSQICWKHRCRTTDVSLAQIIKFCRQTFQNDFTRGSAYMPSQFRLSVCLCVTRANQSKTVQAKAVFIATNSTQLNPGLSWVELTKCSWRVCRYEQAKKLNSTNSTGVTRTGPMAAYRAWRFPTLSIANIIAPIWGAYALYEKRKQLR